MSTAQAFHDAGYGRGTIPLGSRPAVLVVDFQEAFTRPGLPFGGSAHVRAAVRAARPMLAAARAAGVPVVRTVVAWRADGRDLGRWRYKVPGLAEVTPASTFARVDADLADPDDLVYVRTMPSAFFGTPVLSALRVGPQSAGAEPGPAAYARGGDEPTVTDANVVLGYLPPRLIGGEMALDVAGAERAVRTIADAIGLPDAKHAAAGIVDIVNENMCGALRLVSVQQGYDPREFALVAFGGAGPLHGNALARLMGSWPVIVPPSPGVLCAYGEATTTLRNEAARTYIRRFSETSDTEVRKSLEELAAAAQANLDAEGVSRGDQVVSYQVDVRYQGRGFEEAVDVDDSILAGPEGALTRIGEMFDAEHERLFMFSLDTEHELVNLRAVAQTRPPDVEPPRVEQGTADATAARVDTVSVWVGGADAKADISTSGAGCARATSSPVPR